MAWALAWNLERHSLYPTENRGPGAGSPSSGTSEGRWHEECYSWVNAMHSMIAQASVTAASWRRLTRWGVGACLLLLALAWPVPAQAACPGQSFPCDWGFKRKLTFNNSGQVENLVNVPVLVVLNSSRIDYSQTQNQGQDLRFTDSDGTTLLAHEIEQWDEAGTSYVWVKVPQIDGASTTDHIWMFYGNASAVDGQNPPAVWSNGFESVYHLHNAFNDSTGLHASGTNSGSTSSTGRGAHR